MLRSVMNKLGNVQGNRIESETFFFVPQTRKRLIEDRERSEMIGLTGNKLVSNKDIIIATQ